MKGAWTAPVEVATGVQPDGTRHPCWNPVLFEMPDRSLALFYKVGPDPRNWWGMLRTSNDAGRTWSDAQRLPDGILGPIKNKPVRLADGTIISPSSTESNAEPSLWRVHFERSSDGGKTWTIVRPAIDAGAPELQAIQPSILVYPGGKLEAVGRTRSARVFQTWSEDGGKTWTPLRVTALPNPSAGTDAVTLTRWPAADRLQPHAKGAHAAQRRDLARRHGVGRRARARKRAGRVFIPGGDPGGRWQGPHHLHVEAAAGQARRHRPRAS